MFLILRLCKFQVVLKRARDVDMLFGIGRNPRLGKQKLRING
nr:MAG TPA: hypothetical protein [Bacteriophage sp.]